VSQLIMNQYIEQNLL